MADRLIKEYLTDYSLAYQFILQEFVGAAHDDDVAKVFVAVSSIDESEYDGAIYRDMPEPVEKASNFSHFNDCCNSARYEVLSRLKIINFSKHNEILWS